VDISNSFRLCSRLPVVVSSSALSAASLLFTFSSEPELLEELSDAEQESPLDPNEQVLLPAFELQLLVSVEEEQVVPQLPFDVHDVVLFVSEVGQVAPEANTGSINHAATTNIVAFFVIFKSL
jgi:hypothetical protein